MKEFEGHEIDISAIASDRRRSRRQIDGSDDCWEVDDSSLGKYRDSFRDVIPEEEDLDAYTRRRIWESDRQGNAIGLEIGGSGSFFLEFPEGVFEKTAGLRLTDSRTDEERNIEDEQHHTVIEGDILRRSARQSIDAWLNNEAVEKDPNADAEGKIDLLVKKMEGASLYLPTNPFFLARKANELYQRLNKNGGMLLSQIPPGFWDIIHEWYNHVQENYSETLDVQVSRIPKIGNIRLERLPGSPDELPLLSLDQVVQTVNKKESLREYPVIGQYFPTRRRRRRR